MPCNRSSVEDKQADARAAREMADKRRTSGASQLPTVSTSNKTRSRGASRTATPQSKAPEGEDDDYQAHTNRTVISVPEKVELGEFGFDPEYQCKSQVKAVQMATSVAKGTSVQEAAKSMLTTGQDVVLVTSDQGHLLGILTDTDIVKKVVARGLEPTEVLVDDVMTARPMTVPSGTPCLDALKMMVDKKFRHIPVLASDGTVDGVTDLPRCLYDSLATLEKTYHEAHTAMCVLQGLQEESTEGDAASDTMLDGVLREVMNPTVQEVLPIDSAAADVDHSSTVRSAAALMAAKNLTAVLITKGEGSSKELLGILTTKDICRRVVAKKLDANKTCFKWDQSHQVTVMTPSPVSITPDTTIVAALHKMHSKYWSHLPVISGKCPVGVVDLVTVSVYMADIIAKVKRTCTVQSLFSMWEGAQPSVVGVQEQGLPGLGELDEIDACLSQFTQEQLGGAQELEMDDASELSSALHHHETRSTLDEALSDRFENRSQFGGSDISRFTSSARAGMYKIFDGEDWHRFHFPSTNFKEFRVLLCKKLSVDPLVPELLTIYYRDPQERCKYKLTDNNNLSLAKEFGEHTGKDVELIAVLRKGSDREKLYAHPGSIEQEAGSLGGIDLNDSTTKWAAMAVAAAVGVSAAMWLMRK